MLAQLARKKFDINTLSEEEQKLFRKYNGQLPNKMKKPMMDRKYFDSGDYALSKAGKTPEDTVGTAFPTPQNIPHASPPALQQSMSISPTNSTSPVKESALGNGDMDDNNADDVTEVNDTADVANESNASITDKAVLTNN